MLAQSGKLLPVLPAIVSAEHRGVFNTRVDFVRIGERRFQVPDSLKLPRMRRAVIPLVRAGNSVVRKLVTHRLPCLAPVVGALDYLPGPAAALRRIYPIRIGRRSLHVENFPPGEQRPIYIPLFALFVRRQYKRALVRPNQHAHSTNLVSHAYSSPLKPFSKIKPYRAHSCVPHRDSSRCSVPWKNTLPNPAISQLPPASRLPAPATQ